MTSDREFLTFDTDIPGADLGVDVDTDGHVWLRAGSEVLRLRASGAVFVDVTEDLLAALVTAVAIARLDDEARYRLIESMVGPSAQ